MSFRRIDLAVDALRCVVRFGLDGGIPHDALQHSAAIGTLFQEQGLSLQPVAEILLDLSVYVDDTVVAR